MNTRATRTRAVPGAALHKAVMALGAALNDFDRAVEEGDAVSEEEAVFATRTIERAHARLEAIRRALRDQERASIWED